MTTNLLSQNENNSVQGLSVVMAGPLPPAIGGMATVIGDVAHSTLARRVNLVLFNTLKQTAEGRPLWIGISARLKLWTKWWHELRSNKNVVAHIHTCSGLTFFLDGSLLLIARLLRKPVVLHIHGARFDRFLDGLTLPLRWLARWLARRATKVVVLSETWREILHPRLPGAELYVIPNGVPVQDDKLDRSNKSNQVLILFLGNLSQRKGIWELLEAMQYVPESATLVLVGGEDDKGISELAQQKIAELGLVERVNIAGPAYGEAKHEWLEKADIFVLPSHAEGLPIALLEAMGSGLPSVVSAVGAMPSVIDDGVQGKVIEPGDIRALSEALSLFVKDKDLRQRMGEAGRLRCQERYGVERSAENYMRLYREII